MIKTKDISNIYEIRKIISKFLCTNYAKDIVSRNLYSVQIIPKENKKLNFQIPSLAIDFKGNLYLNLEFLETYVKDEDDLACLFSHEILHQIFGDCLDALSISNIDPDAGLKHLAQNIAMDIRINSYVVKICEKRNLSYKVFDNIYKTLINENNDKNEKITPIYKLLAPYSSFTKKELENQHLAPVIKEYQDLYFNKSSSIISYYESYTNIYNYLKEIKDKSPNVLLLGNHGQLSIEEQEALLGQDPNEDTDGNNLPIKSPLENIKDGFEHELDEGIKAGYSDIAASSILQIRDGQFKLNLNYFKRLSFKSHMSNVKIEGEKKSRYNVASPSVPKVISKKDLFMLNFGFVPTLWKKKIEVEEKIPKMLPIYLDVSGSMTSYLPEIIRLILNIQEDIEYVWGFSNKIFKHTFEDLSNGKIKSTGGTDFVCILDHAKEQEYSSILVITDGDAYCPKPLEKLDWLKEAIVVLCSPYRNRNNWLSNVYNNTLEIEDVTI